jgi:hypothetical protein
MAIFCYLSLLLRVGTGKWAFTCHKFAGVNVLTELAAAAGNASMETKEHAVPITLHSSLLSALHFFDFLAAICANHLIQWLSHLKCLRYHALPT